MIDDHRVPTSHSPPRTSIGVSHSARVWDYWLGGKDNYPADRRVGDQIAQIVPDIAAQARASRLFLGRAVRYLAQAGIGQFLDIGTGLPAAGNAHEVAQQVAPGARTVYVDNDPLVLAYGRALLTSAAGGAVACVDADLRDPADILAGAAATLDLSRPVAVTMLAVLWHILDDGQAQAIVTALMRPLAPGSYLVITHPTLEVSGQRMATAIRHWNQHGTPPGTARSPAQLTRLLGGLELVAPGLVPCTRWRPEDSGSGEPEPVDLFCAVARKE
jgi:SAM-dependent methyltransferase